MNKEYSVRQLRISESAKRITAKFISENISLKGDMISISFADISKDLSHCRLYATCFKEENQKQMIKILEANCRELEVHLFKELSLKKGLKVKISLDPQASFFGSIKTDIV